MNGHLTTTLPAVGEGTSQNVRDGSEIAAESQGSNNDDDRPQQRSWSLTSSSSWGATAAATVAAAGKVQNQQRQQQQHHGYAGSSGVIQPSSLFGRSSWVRQHQQNLSSPTTQDACCVSDSNPLHSNVEIRLGRPSRIYEAGELVEGAVRIHVKDGWSHHDINLRACGTVALQKPTALPNNSNSNESFTNSSRLTVLDQCILIKPRGKIYRGGIYQYPFSFPLVGLGGEDLLETYRGLYIQVTFTLHLTINRTSFLSRTLETEMEIWVQVPSFAPAPATITPTPSYPVETTPTEPQVPMIPDSGTRSEIPQPEPEKENHIIFIDTLEAQAPSASNGGESGSSSGLLLASLLPSSSPKINIRAYLKRSIIALADQAAWYDSDCSMIDGEEESDDDSDDGVVTGHLVVEDTCGIPVRSIKARLFRVEMIRRQAGSTAGSSSSPLALFTTANSSAPTHAPQQHFGDGRGVSHTPGFDGEGLVPQQPPLYLSSPRPPSHHHYHHHHVPLASSSPLGGAPSGNGAQPHSITQTNAPPPPTTRGSSSFHTFRTEISTWQIADGDVGRGIALPLHIPLPSLSVCPSLSGFRNTLKLQFEMEILVLLGETDGGSHGKYRARGSLPLTLYRRRRRREQKEPQTTTQPP